MFTEFSLQSRLCSECCARTHIVHTTILLSQKRKWRQEKVKSLKPHNDSVGEPVFELEQCGSRACMHNSSLLPLPPASTS